MRVPPPEKVSQLLFDWSKGDKAALDALVPLVHEELHRLAHRYMGGELPGQTIQTTALINEAYLRLTDYRNMRWQNRAHFFAIAAKVMRHVLVDYARRRHSVRRGGGTLQVSLDEAMVLSADTSAELIAVEEALNDLAAFDPRMSQIVELRFFGGMTPEETAEVLEISPRTVLREWQRAKAWLYLAINKGLESDK